MNTTGGIGSRVLAFFCGNSAASESEPQNNSILDRGQRRGVYDPEYDSDSESEPFTPVRQNSTGNQGTQPPGLQNLPEDPFGSADLMRSVEAEADESLSSSSATSTETLDPSGEGDNEENITNPMWDSLSDSNEVIVASFSQSIAVKLFVIILLGILILGVLALLCIL